MSSVKENVSIACQQVLSAKVVTNARSPGSKCYGLVTMSSSTEVTRCVSHLDCTELHGQQIFVERVSEEADVRSKCNAILFLYGKTFGPKSFVFHCFHFFFRPKMIRSKRRAQRRKLRTKQVSPNHVISAALRG